MNKQPQGKTNAGYEGNGRRFRVEKLLAAAVRDMAQSRTEDAILQFVADYTYRITLASLAVVFTPDPDGWLRARARQGEGQLYLEERRINVAGGIGLAAAALSGERTLCHAADGPCPPETDPLRWRAWRERAAAHGFRWLVLVPIRYKNRSLGLVNYYTSRREQPSAAGREAVENMALVAAGALHGLRLREETLLTLTRALEGRDDETQAHARRVALYTQRLAEEVGVRDPEEAQFLRWGALLHDVGKIGLSDAVLRKPGPLTPEEWREVIRHPRTGYHLLADLEFLGGAREIVLAHHERWDGSGYPGGLRGRAIPLGARIFTVVDAFDAMTSDRPYRRAVSVAAAASELRRAAGTQFDPDVVDAFGRIGEGEWENLRRQAEAGFFSPFGSAGGPG